MRTDPVSIEMRDLAGGPLDLEVNCDPKVLDLEDDEFTFTQNVTGMVQFNRIGKRVLGKGTLQAEASSPCVRCLEPAHVIVEVPIDCIFENDPDLLNPKSHVVNPDDQIVNYFDGDLINPREEFREAILVALPTLPICRPDCKGLCPTCGSNLNVTECKCARDGDDTEDWKSQLKNLRLE